MSNVLSCLAAVVLFFAVGLVSYHVNTPPLSVDAVEAPAVIDAPADPAPALVPAPALDTAGRDVVSV